MGLQKNLWGGLPLCHNVGISLDVPQVKNGAISAFSDNSLF